MSDQPTSSEGHFDDFPNWEHTRQQAILTEHAERRSDSLSDYRIVVELLRKKAHRSDPDRDLYELAVRQMSIDEMTHMDLVTLGRTLKAPISTADSFFRNVAVRRRKKQLGPVPEKYLGITKDKDLLMAECLGIRTPEMHFVGGFDEIPHRLRRNTILKPMISSGSKGAYYLFDEMIIFSIQHSKALSNWEELRGAIVTQFGENAVHDREWQVQELILEKGGLPARDMKFYAFYGKIGLIQEVIRMGSMQYEFFNEDFTIAACGRESEPRFKDKSLTVTDKGGLSEDKLNAVRTMSEQIPAPLLRIDFLNAESELVFIEFSAAPGRADSFNAEYDRLLGRYYHEAELRLVNDLLAGKQFEGYHEFTRRMQTQAGPQDAPKSLRTENPRGLRQSVSSARNRLRRLKYDVRRI